MFYIFLYTMLFDKKPKARYLQKKKIIINVSQSFSVVYTGGDLVLVDVSKWINLFRRLLFIF